MNSPPGLSPAGPLLYWIRESTPKNLEHDLGVPLPAVLPRLPAVLVERLAGALAGHPEITEVHLPYIQRRDWPVFRDILNGTHFEVRDSRLLPERYCRSAAEWNLYQARLIAVTAFQPGAASRCWREAPRQGQASHFAAYAPLSPAVQNVLRHAVATLWMPIADRAICYEEVCSVLGYLASPPYIPRTLTEFTYDVQSASWFHSAFRLARKPLAQLLAALRSHLIAAGRTDLAGDYDPDQPRLILEQIRRNPRRAKSIFAREEAIVYLVVDFGSAISRAAAPFEAVQAITPVVRDLEIQLRRLAPGLDLTPLAACLLIEATAAVRLSRQPRDISPAAA